MNIDTSMNTSTSEDSMDSVNSVVYKNVFIITSVCNPSSSPLTYSGTRSVFTPEQRFEQLLNTIKSVREKVGNDTVIVLIECSPLTRNQTDILFNMVDSYYNLYYVDVVREQVSSPYKGLGERVLALFGLRVVKILIDEEINKNNINVFKLSGRYVLNDSFDLEQYVDNDKMVFHPILDQKTNINTTLYKVCSNNHLDLLIEYMDSDPDKVVRDYHGSMELYMGEFVGKHLDQVKFVNKLGVSGRVSVCGSLYEN